MLLRLQNLLLSNATLKISALFMGISLWSIMHESYQARITIPVPVCFYNLVSGAQIKAPEQVHITLTGTHAHLRKLDQKALALHIDAGTLKHGMNSIDINTRQLLLPPEINLVHYKPLHLLVNN